MAPSLASDVAWCIRLHILCKFLQWVVKRYVQCSVVPYVWHFESFLLNLLVQIVKLSMYSSKLIVRFCVRVQTIDSRVFSIHRLSIFHHAWLVIWESDLFGCVFWAYHILKIDHSEINCEESIHRIRECSKFDKILMPLTFWNNYDFCSITCG